jgi:hypothetical protein
MVTPTFPPAECHAICGLLSAIACAEGRLSLEEELFLKIVADELGVAVGSNAITGSLPDPLLLSESARAFSATAGTVLANMGGDCLTAKALDARANRWHIRRQRLGARCSLPRQSRARAH